MFSMSLNKIKNFMTKLLSGDSGESPSDTAVAVKKSKKKGKGQSPEAMSVDSILKEKDLTTLLACAELKDGYKREAAVLQLGVLGDPVAISDLLKRANDWVPEIRSAAKIALRKLATPENAEAFVMSLPELYHLRKCGRANHSQFISEIENYLIEPVNVLTIHSGLNDSDSEVSKGCFSLVLKHKLAESNQFILNALQHKDVNIRLRASHLIHELDEKQKQEAYKIALDDKHMVIRRDAFLSLMQSWGNTGLAKKMLFDDHPGIREIAVAHLSKAGEDVQYTYLHSLSSDYVQDICAALWGLGFLKVAECTTLVKPFLAHENSKVRTQAQLTIDALDKLPEKFIDTVEWNSIDTQY